MKSIFDLLKMSNLLLLHYTTGWFREFEIKLKEEYNAHIRRQFSKAFVLRQSKRKCNLKCKLKFTILSNCVFCTELSSLGEPL